MSWQQLVADIYNETSMELEHALEGLTVNDLNQRPDSNCNSIGWLAWHLARGQDADNEGLFGEEQVWIKDKWYNKFDRAPDPMDTGYHHSPEDIAVFRSPDRQTLIEYYYAVLQKTLCYLNNNLTEDDLEREFENPIFPKTTKVRRLLVAIISDNLQHVGQIAYVRGLLKGKGWSDI
jgi:hypothetical protein